MRARFHHLILLTSLIGPGCSLVHEGTTAVTARTCDVFEDCVEHHRNRKWAEDAWKKFRADATTSLSDDYAKGFKEGFAQYLYEGGTGEPPPLPPRRYRKLRYQTPQGYQAVEDWFTGYRQGASVAQEAGYRRWVTGPSSLSAGHGADLHHSDPPPELHRPVFLPRRRIPFRVIPQPDEPDLPAPRKFVPDRGQATGEIPHGK